MVIARKIVTLAYADNLIDEVFPNFRYYNEADW